MRLYRMVLFPMTLSDLKLPQITLFSTLHRLSYLRNGYGATDFKFGA